MDTPILVSVLCTAYNHEAYIREALDSMVGQQTDFAYEILVSDDVSTDSTRDIIREYEAKYPDKVRGFYLTENLYSQGRDVYYEVFFPNARGKYTAFCEGDDCWTDMTKLQRQVDFLESHPDYTACVHNTELLKYAGARSEDTLATREEDCDMEFADILPGMSHAWHTSSLLGRTDLLANPPDFYTIAADAGFGDFPYALWLRLNGKIRFLARFMSRYRLSSGADSWSADQEKQTSRRTRFFRGVIDMLTAFKAHTEDEALRKLTDEWIDRWNFQLLYTLGKDRELRKPPYRAILREKPLAFRVKNFVKCTFPALHRLYRRRRGYNEKEEIPMKKLLLLGGSSYLLPVIREAHELGIHVITCDYLPNNAAHKYADEYRNVSIIEKEAVLQTARELQIDGVMSFACDPGVTTAAYVAEQMGLPFAGSFESVSILQDKGRFRAFLRDNGFTVPWARRYTEKAAALEDAAGYPWPMIVKPVDSAGSKGVTRVDTAETLPAAIDHALDFSHSGAFIVEQFIQQKGYSSDTDCFSVDGKLVYCSFDEQRFDPKAENPYTPAAYTWPSSMPAEIQAELRRELQRLMTLLDLKTSVYNIETRQGTDGKAYIMEVSPRGGGNRLCEVLEMAAGTKLIQNAVRAAVGLPVDEMQDPVYRGHWAEIILHSEREGDFETLWIDPAARAFVAEEQLWVAPGEHVERFSGANRAIGTLVLNFPDRETLERYMSDDGWYKVVTRV